MRANLCDHPHSPLAGVQPGHDHGHAHTHGHRDGHRPRERRALGWCIVLTAGMFVVEVAGSLWTHSLMLLSDAAHMLSHVLALSISYAAVRLASRPPGPRSHFGMYRAEILGALANAVGVLVFTVWIVYESVGRFLEPREVMGGEMTLIAGVGLGVNLLTAFLLHRSGAEDLNTKSAFVHMLGDTLSSVAIVIGGFVLMATGWAWIDPILSLLVALLIAIWGWKLLRESCSILLEMAPDETPPDAVRRAILEEEPAVQDLHDLHVWQITTGYVCLTAHVVVDDSRLSEIAELREKIGHLVEERFHISHVTLQFEHLAAAG